RVRLANGAVWSIASRRAFSVGDPVVVSVRPEQLWLTDTPGDDRFPVHLTLSLPIGGDLIHDVSSTTGDTLKVAAARRPGAPAMTPGAHICALSPHAKPSLFPRPDA
ncbi:MAG: ABC transporter ATP-binding protein, partial [Alphaproteobacteria bacterium]